MKRYYKYGNYEEFYLKSEAELNRQAPAPLVAVLNVQMGWNASVEIEKIAVFER